MDYIAPHPSTASSMADHTAPEGITRRCIRYVGCVLTLASVVWGSAGGLGESRSSEIVMTSGGLMELEQFINVRTRSHGEYLAAAFGVQSSASALITIKIYHTRTGTVLSEESFDLNVQEDGLSIGEMHRGRIFAGGIGVDPGGPTRFLLRAYDAVTGRFLWEGQLNFRSHRNEPKVRPIASVVPLRSAERARLATEKSPVRVYLSLRAIDAQTGRIAWEDRFTPGVDTTKSGGVVRFDLIGAAKNEKPMSYAFHLVVRAWEPGSARLLWQDSFEDPDAIEWTDRGREEALEPQALPRHPQRKFGPTRL